MSAKGIKKRDPRGEHRTTPIEVVQLVKRFKRIYLDPCSNQWSVVNADYFYEKSDDGLALSWAPWLSSPDGCVFINPDWSKIGSWVAKAEEVSAEHHHILFWTPVSPETKWSKHLHQISSVWVDWGKRIHHPLPWSPKGSPEGATRLWYIGNDVLGFAHFFENLGCVGFNFHGAESYVTAARMVW